MSKEQWKNDRQDVKDVLAAIQLKCMESRT